MIKNDPVLRPEMQKRNFKKNESFIFFLFSSDGFPKSKHLPSCGCNNIISSSSHNLQQLESFFCQWWPNLCENSLICDINHNSLQSIQHDEAELEEQNSNSIASSSLMLIIPEERSLLSLLLCLS